MQPLSTWTCVDVKQEGLALTEALATGIFTVESHLVPCRRADGELLSLDTSSAAQGLITIDPFVLYGGHELRFSVTVATVDGRTASATTTVEVLPGDPPTVSVAVPVTYGMALVGSELLVNPAIKVTLRGNAESGRCSTILPAS